MRRAAKVDKNQPAIVKALRAHGVIVQHLHQMGQGVPDLLVGHKGRLVLLEIKATTKDHLTMAEARFHRMWEGFPVFVVTSPKEALAAAGVSGF